MYSEGLIKKISKVLDSGLTPYMIAKKVGYASANPIHKLIKGSSKIEQMTLEKAIAFERLYESEKKSGLL